MYVCVCVCVCMHACMHVCMYVYMHACRLSYRYYIYDNLKLTNRTFMYVKLELLVWFNPL